MRRKTKINRKIEPDSTYNSVKVSKLVSYVMKSGKKNTARKIVNNSFEIIKEKLKTTNPLEIFESALRNVAPTMEVRSRRVGGANYQIPIEVRLERRMSLALRWILLSARTKKGKPMAEKLAEELISASKNEGDAVRKRENVHKMAESNKAFAHFAW